MHTIIFEGNQNDLFDHMHHVGVIDESRSDESHLVLVNGQTILFRECTDGVITIREPDEPAKAVLRRISVTTSRRIRLTLQHAADFATFCKEYATSLTGQGKALFGDIEVAPWAGQRRDVIGIIS